MRERWRRGEADCLLVFAGIYGRSPPPPPAVGLAEKGVHFGLNEMEKEEDIGLDWGLGLQNRILCKLGNVEMENSPIQRCFGT